MRVLLFVQHGDARPKVAWQPRGFFIGEWRPSDVLAAAPVGVCREMGDNAWWLVECANAEDGRDVIEWECTGGSDTVLNKLCPFGRILASGGRRA